MKIVRWGLMVGDTGKLLQGTDLIGTRSKYFFTSPEGSKEWLTSDYELACTISRVGLVEAYKDKLYVSNMLASSKMRVVKVELNIEEEEASPKDQLQGLLEEALAIMR